MTYGPGHRGVDLAARTGEPVCRGGRRHGGIRGVGGRPRCGEHRPRSRADHLRAAWQPRVRAGQRVRARPADRPGVRRRRTARDAACTGAASRGKTYLDPLLLLGGRQQDRSGCWRRPNARSRRSGLGREPRLGPDPTRARAARSRPPSSAGAVHGFLHPVPGGVTSAFGMRFHPVLQALEAARRHRLRRGLRHPDPGAVRRRVTRAYFNVGYGQPAHSRPRHGRRSSGRDGAQPRDALSWSGQVSAITPRPGDRLRRQHRLCDRVPPAPDGVAERRGW